MSPSSIARRHVCVPSSWLLVARPDNHTTTPGRRCRIHCPHFICFIPITLQGPPCHNCCCIHLPTGHHFIIPFPPIPFPYIPLLGDLSHAPLTKRRPLDKGIASIFPISFVPFIAGPLCHNYNCCCLHLPTCHHFIIYFIPPIPFPYPYITHSTIILVLILYNKTHRTLVQPKIPVPNVHSHTRKTNF